MHEKHQHTGPNFNEWLRALKLVVRTEKLQDVFETPLPPAPAASADNQALADWNALFDRHNEVACLMLGTMSPKLYQQFENKSPQEMITELQKMYGKPPGVELQELVNSKAKGKEKGKGLKNSYPTKPKKPQPYKKERPAKDGQCHHCKEEGHWKRNCPLYLAELKRKRNWSPKNVASTSSSIYTIELFSFPKNFWVYDTGCGTHVCNIKQGLRGAKKLKRDFLEKDFILQKESGRNVELDDEDILPSENTSEHPIEEESLAPIVSQEEDVVPVRRSVRTHKAPNRLCLNVEIDPDRLSFNIEVEEHSLGDLNEPANYRSHFIRPVIQKRHVSYERGNAIHE
ncbi:retrotransposon protein, putative, ty1-copia subclass [Tanacetum coccineum]